MPQIYVHIGLPKTATTTLQTQVLMPHEGWCYVGTRLPRILNVDPTFALLDAFVNRGQGTAEAVQCALKDRWVREQKPLFVSEENFSIGAFPGASSESSLSQMRSAKFARLAASLEGLDALVLVGLRPFRDAVFSAYVEYQNELQGLGVEAVATVDALGMYQTHKLREELEALWPGKVVPVAFEDIVMGTVQFPGFQQQKPKSPLPNMRRHPRTHQGVLREIDVVRPFKPLARLVAPWSARLAHSLWRVKRSRTVVVARWSEYEWRELATLEAASDAARTQWLSES